MTLPGGRRGGGGRGAGTPDDRASSEPLGQLSEGPSPLARLLGHDDDRCMRRIHRQAVALTAASTLVAGILVGGGWWLGNKASPPSGAPAPSSSAAPTASAPPVPTPSPTTGAPTSPTTAPTRSSGEWQMLRPAPVTEWTYGVMAVWTGSELLVYHAYPVAAEPATTAGYGYHPGTHRWRRLAPIPAPPDVAEGGNRAIWTGTEMVVQGLINGAYNPATDRWRPLGSGYWSRGGPGAGSVQVWTGREVLTWGGGGCCGAAPNATGTAYNPLTDEVRSLPASPLAGRRDAAAAWTGTEMIIVGGQGADDATAGAASLADAAAYNPAARTWRRLPPLPAPRTNATATWTGSEVLVVGGQSDHPTHRTYADGLAYDPAANRWRPLPAMPAGRVGHAAVWTGDQLLVWGGKTWRDTGWATPPRGYVYRPASNRWSPMPTSPLRGRIGFAAAWTGAQMMIWGGEPVGGASPNLPAFVDGASYRP